MSRFGDGLFGDGTFGGGGVSVASEGADELTITEGLDFVFYEGEGGFNANVPQPWPISIAGRAFVIDLAHYAWHLPDMVRQAIDFSARPGEQSFDTGGVWLRASGDWSMGAGQHYLDSDRSSTRRFESSLGVDPWTQRQLSLLPDVERWATFLDTGLHLLAHGAYLYLITGTDQNLYRTTDPANAAFVDLVQITGGPVANFVDATSDGNNIYVATSAGIYVHQVIAGTTMAAMAGAAGATAAEIIEYANGWLLIGNGNVLSSVDAAGAVTAVHTHPTTTFHWTSIVGTPSNIYAGGQADTTGEIYRISIDPATGGLAIPIHAGTLPGGETLHSMAHYGGRLLLGTSEGLHLAEINGDGSLSLGPLVDTDSAVECAIGEAEFVWFGWSNYDDSHTGLGRAKLSEFPEPFLPAHAGDLMVPNVAGAVNSIARFAGETYFSVESSGFYRKRKNGNLVATGTITLGRLEWSTFVPKSFLGVEVVTAPLAGRVAIAATDDENAVTELGFLAKQGATNLGSLLGAGKPDLSTFFNLTLTLTRSSITASEGPTVRLVTARGLPVPRSIQRWVLPIICKEHVRIGADDDQDASQDVSIIRDFFVALRNAGVTVPLQEGQSQHQVVVRDVAMPEGTVEHWGTNRAGLQGMLMVTVDSVEG